MNLESKIVFSGIGQSAVGRKQNRSALNLTLDACLGAIEDAGLSIDQIDGLSSYPGFRPDLSPGFAPVGIGEVQNSLGLKLNWYSGGMEVPAQAGAIVNACAAVAGGLAKHVICFRTVTESSSSAGKKAGVQGAGATRISGPLSWQVPFQAISASTILGLSAQRHFHLYGTNRETLGEIAVNNRRNAALNPSAVFRKELSMDDYMSSRMISSPFCLFDCDVPVDASTAIIISHIDEISCIKGKPVYLDSIGTAMHGKDSWDNYGENLTDMAAQDAADMMWARSQLSIEDVDFGAIYDGFTYLTLTWLEALGICAKGESKDFVKGGKNISREGLFPINTNGGQLSGGRTHGFGYMHEAILQLRGEAKERQLSNSPKTAVVTNGGGPIASCFLLRNYC